MGVVQFLYHPDTVLTASDLEILAEGLLAEIPIPGVEAAAFDSGIIRRTLLQAAVDQTSIKAVTESTRGTYSDDYTLAQLHTIPPKELEAVVNLLLRQQATKVTSLLALCQTRLPSEGVLYRRGISFGRCQLSPRYHRITCTKNPH